MIGKKLKKIRQELGKNQTEMAWDLGTTQCNLSNWEMDKVDVSVSTLLNICEKLNCSPNYMLGWKTK